MFQDPNWVKKMLIGGVLSIIPIFGTLVVFGYWIRIASNVANNRELPLPEWNDFGGDFMRGLRAAVAVFLWAVPLIVFAACGVIPVATSGDSGAGALATLISFGALAVAFVLWIAVAFISPIIVGRVSLTGSISSAFEFREILVDARDNLVPLLIAVAMAYALGFVAYFGVILCFVGYLFTQFLAYMMVSHLYRQIWRRLRLTPSFGTELGTGTISTDPGV
ncbi:MAG TPA: DUF4013 domain-containing protein [Nitrolancea sp.]|nr:DUF4013 domain-containing protein [Nitrolancea sp.]